MWRCLFGLQIFDKLDKDNDGEISASDIDLLEEDTSVCSGCDII